MELISIARALWRRPTGALLVGLQIAISLAIVINAALFVHTRIEKVSKANGMDTENIIVVKTIAADDHYPSRSAIAADLETINQLPGVISSATAHSVPESGSGSATSIKNGTQETSQKVILNYYRVGQDIENTLGLTLVQGSRFQAHDVEYNKGEHHSVWAKKIIITRNVAEQLFPNESAVGKLVYSHLNQPAEVIGVVEHMHGAWPNWENFGKVALIPLVSSQDDANLLVRVEPGMREQLQVTLEQTLRQDQSRRLIDEVTTMQAMRDETYNGDTALAKLLLVVITLLTVVSALGVIALASFTVKQRTRQIGTRRAIGAHKHHIMAYFFQENNLICLGALLLGSALSILLNMLLVEHFAMPKLAPAYILIGCLLLWLASLLAVYRPAKVAASISPVVATRNV